MQFHRIDWQAFDPEGALRADCLDYFVIWAFGLIEPHTQYAHGPHISIICDELEKVTKGELEIEAKDGQTPMLVINVPPGHMKSLLVSVFWPVWTWIRRPGKRFVNTAYREALALRDADKARELIRHPEFQALYGDCFAIRKDQDTARRYTNEDGGYRYSCATAGIMGEGGDFVILDDPHNVDQAESDDVRNEVVRKLRLALPSRVRSPTGAVVCIMQRLHELDFVGVTLDKDPESTRIVCLPARYEHDHPFVFPGDKRAEGELLYPNLWNEGRLAGLEKTLGSYGSAGQLQQRPAPREGGMFKRDWFNIIDSRPQNVRWVRGWDLAATKDEKAARTAGVLMGRYRRHGEDRYVVAHVALTQDTPGKVEALVKRTAKQDGHAVTVDLPQDPGQAGKAQIKRYVSLLRGYSVKWSPESGDKIQRADAFAAQAEAGSVDIVRGDWNEKYLDELAGFYYGRFADQVDASSRAFHRLENPELRFGRTRGT